MFSFLPFSFERSWYHWWSSFAVLFRLFLFITLVMSRKLIMRFKFHYRLSIARNLSKFQICKRNVYGIAYWFSLVLKLRFYYKLYPTCYSVYHDRLVRYLVESLSYFSYLLPLSYITFLSSVHVQSKHVSFPGNIIHTLQRKWPLDESKCYMRSICNLFVFIGVRIWSNM